MEDFVALTGGIGVLAAFEAKDGFAAALTIEGVVFVAFSLSYSLRGYSKKGRNRFFTKGGLGWLTVVVIATVALAGVFDWIAIFSKPHQPHGFREKWEAYALLGGVIAQPILAAFIATQVPD
ncbi:MAG TPA: hypothetical protein VGK79_16475 [Gaiellaceae bacterium]